jgi:putative flavoprotein involved in K+ transport
LSGVSRWLESFAGALARQDIEAAIGMFEPGGFWRDLVAFTWNIKTCEGRDEIRAMLAATLAGTRPSNFRVTGEPKETDGVTEAWFAFETAAGRGVGQVRLREGRCWTLLTTLRELKGFEEKPDVEPRVNDKPYVVIIGGGQGGIGLAARLKRIGVPAVIIEKNARAGDSWRKRYKSLVLHDPVWYDHMPYLPFPEGWPVFTPKDMLGDWLENYVKAMGLDFRGSTRCIGAKYESGEWVVSVLRDEKQTAIRARHLVLATGMSGVPSIPAIPGAETFKGTIRHSSAFPGGEGWGGKRCVVVGASTSAHDICADLWQNGADVTMLQRSPTIVATSEALTEYAWGRLYSKAAVESGITTDIADLTVASMPMKLLPAMQKPLYEKIAQRDAALYAGLARAGFRFDFGEDGSGIHSLYLRRGSGYYIEVGASKMIIEGKIKLKSPASVVRLNERSVTLIDGKGNETELPADLVVFATGYGSMNGWAAELISPEVAARVGKCWGLGSATKYDPGPWVGELRNMWKPTQQPGLWFHGGNLMQSRHYSLYLALQLKARMEGMATPVYGMDAVRHLS